MHNLKVGEEAISNIAAGQTIYRDVTFDTAFENVPKIFLTIKGSAGEQTIEEVSATKNGFQFFANNSATIPVSYTVNWLAVD